MYAVSKRFLEAIDSNARRCYWTGDIKTKNGRSYEFTDEDIVKGSGYITRSCCGNSEIELGSVYAAELGITLYLDVDRYTLDEARVRLFYHLQYEDGSEEVVPMGIFEVSEANRNIKTVELKAYDYMLRFEKKLNLESSSGTPYNFLNVICNTCKVELGHTQGEIDAMTNGRETLGIYSENDIETYRDLLFYVAQVLGCVCQINREGKLVLIPYGKTAVRTVEQRHRFDSSYSDFVTRYTAISSTNKITETAEYYALDPDDGLTMNLGVNPMLQFGLKTTRARLLNAILKAISLVEYVPFDSNTIGNPALDPMDCLIFRGGHADETKISCITNITYKINGKQALKCVGKNPRLAEAKSKNDKNITGLLNQVEENKTVVYDFVNVEPYEIYDKFTEVLAITFVSKESTSAMFLAEVLLDVQAYETTEKISGKAAYEDTVEDQEQSQEKQVDFSFVTKTHPYLEVMYKINGEELEDFHPTQIFHEGKQLVTLFLPISAVEENSENTFTMWFKMEDGFAKIGETQIRATLSGQGLVAGIGDWNGRISVTDSFENIAIKSHRMRVVAFNTSVSATFPGRKVSGFSQSFGRIEIAQLDFGYDLLNERVTCVEVVQSFTMNKDCPGEYNPTEIELNEDGAFQMICDYTYTSSQEEIACGQVQVLTVDTTGFERVESQEVMVCEL